MSDRSCARRIALTPSSRRKRASEPLSAHIVASDLHIKVPSGPRIRVNGELIDLPGYQPVSPEDAEGIREHVLRSELARERYETNGSSDLSYYTDNSRFRVNAFRQRGSASF